MAEASAGRPPSTARYRFGIATPTGTVKTVKRSTSIAKSKSGQF
ncbi:hypothetical protein CCACVL1_08572 [Corchorus capsularis]|uniref:Uncharacterized protein n=1 Tax=Corchorus capsularis TaxID=210143 RepID=A0A1R3IZL6_COCAP|nr:hypothetical protein CCACVL1_08572 [Corchorus capsularis]